MSHSAKRARHTVHRQSLLCRVLFLGHSAKRFAECQGALGKEKRPLRRRVTETAALPSVNGDTRQRRYLCRVSSWQHSAKKGSLPSASDITLGKEPKPVPRSVLFAECYDPDTRQRASLPSVTLGKVTSIYLFYLFFVFHPHKQKISHIYITDIITDINSQHKHKTVTTNINIHHKHKCSTQVLNTNISLKRRKLSHKYQTQT